ncbi:MAG: IclR family transcriptional regulator [Lachnospiraceae bacterium]|nr:IclR family transcriptional regulator [Lachnospiraceae bacterium]
MSNKELHRPTLRVLKILEAAAFNKQGFTLTEMAEYIDAPKSSIFPVLNTLVDQKYLYYNRQNLRYFIGMKAYEVGQTYARQTDVLKDISEIILNMVNVCGETSHFAVLDDGNIFYLITHDSPDRVRVFTTVGARMPAYATSLGKALLLDHTKKELEDMYPDQLPLLTTQTIPTVSALFGQLETFQKEQMTFEDGESNANICCYAVPIRKSGQIIAALSISIRRTHYSEEKAELVQALLKNARTKIELLVQDADVNFSR